MHFVIGQRRHLYGILRDDPHGLRRSPDFVLVRGCGQHRHNACAEHRYSGGKKHWSGTTEVPRLRSTILKRARFTGSGTTGTNLRVVEAGIAGTGSSRGRSHFKYTGRICCPRQACGSAQGGSTFYSTDIAHFQPVRREFVGGLLPGTTGVAAREYVVHDAERNGRDHHHERYLDYQSALATASTSIIGQEIASTGRFVDNRRMAGARRSGCRQRCFSRSRNLCAGRQQ